MTIKTKFNEGDKVLTLNTDTLKVKDFNVARIVTYTSKGVTNVTLYDSDDYCANGYDESKCFATEAELLKHITTKESTESQSPQTMAD